MREVTLSNSADVTALSEWVEAERCWAIFSAPLARERPSATWNALPLGLGISETLTLVETLPATPGDKTYSERLALLAERKIVALAAWRARQTCDSRVVN